MKFNRRGLVLLTAAMTLTTCKNSQQSDQPSSSVAPPVEISMEILSEPSLDKQEPENRAAAYVELFRQGQFDSFYQEAGMLLQNETTQERLKQKWSGLMTAARVYGGSESIQTTQAEGKISVQVASVHSRYHVLTSFALSGDGTVETLSMDLGPLAVAPELGENREEIPIQPGYNAQKQLSGTPTLSKRVENPPVVILVHGSGTQGIDCRIGTTDNRPFVDLAQEPADNGIAPICYDKRSYVYPEDVIDIQTEHLHDVQDAVRFALEGLRVNDSQLCLIGHSQGGMFSPKFALDNPEIKGIVSLGGTPHRIEDTILEQNKTTMEQNTILSEEEKAAHIAKIQSGLDRAHGLTPESTDVQDEMLLGYPASYRVSLNTIDQKATAQELTIPILILQGDNDFQVRYNTGSKLWQEVLGGRENVVFRHYAGLSHMLMPGNPERFDSSSYDAPAKMDAQIIQDISGWTHSQTEEESWEVTMDIGDPFQQNSYT